MRNFQGTISADGSVTFSDVDAGEYGFVMAGTWGGGTIELTLVRKSDNTIAFDVFGTDTQLSANGQFTLKVPAGCDVKLTLSGATTPDLDYNFGWVGA